MKISRPLLALAFGVFCLGATHLAEQRATDDERVMWRKLLEHDVGSYTDAVFARPPSGGGHGVGAIGFRVNDSIQGCVLLSALDGHGLTVYEPSAGENLPDEARVTPALGVFVAVGAPSSAGDGPYDDLRLTFTLDDETVLTVAPSAGGGPGMLFKSPSDLAVSEIASIALHVDDTADWAK